MTVTFPANNCGYTRPRARMRTTTIYPINAIISWPLTRAQQGFVFAGISFVITSFNFLLLLFTTPATYSHRALASNTTNTETEQTKAWWVVVTS